MSPLSRADDIEAYLDLTVGEHAVAKFHNLVGPGQQRIGQAFFNCLNEEDQRRLTGSLYDPFYKDDLLSVLVALDYLLGMVG